MKWRAGAPAGMYDAEAAGLRALAGAASCVPGPDALVRVPQVVAVSAEGAWLLLEYIENGQRSDRTDEMLGRGLAGIHATPTADAAFGWAHDNWIGSLPQRNRPSASWPAFWRDQRIGPQLQLARSKGYFTSETDGGGRMDDLLGVLDPILSHVGTPALLHGDLWGGNAYADAEGLPVMIDPAVYRGDPEVDLAMTELFGGFGPHFYDAYTEVRPVSDAYHAYLRDLYQLYYLLAHVNLFGGSYVGSSVRAARRVLGELG